MNDIVESIDRATTDFNHQKNEFLFQYGLRALSTLDPVTFREHGFWSEQIQPHHFANYFDVFHENRFELYKRALGILSSDEADSLHDVRSIYQRLLAAISITGAAKRNYEHIKLPVNPLLFSIILKRHLQGLTERLDFTQVLEIGPGTSATALYLLRSGVFKDHYTGVENTLPLYILQKLLAELAPMPVKNQEHRPLNFRNITAFEWPQITQKYTLVLANHCLTEIDEFARRAYIHRLSRSGGGATPAICGIGFGGKRVLGVPLIEQYRDLMRSLHDQGLVLAYYRGFKKSESLTELKFFCFLDANSLEALQIQLPGKEPQRLSLEDYEILISQFQPALDVHPIMGEEKWVEDAGSSSIREPGISIEQVIGGTYEETIEEKFIRETGLKR